MVPSERQAFVSLIDQAKKDGTDSFIAPFFSDKPAPMYPTRSWTDLLNRGNNVTIPNANEAERLPSWHPEYDPARPAKSLSRIFLALNFERVTSQIEQLPNVDIILPGLLGALSCRSNQFDTFIPTGRVDEFHKTMQAIEKLQQSEQDNFLHAKEQRLGSAIAEAYKSKESGDSLFSSETNSDAVQLTSMIQWLIGQVESSDVQMDDWFVTFERNPFIWDVNRGPREYLEKDLWDLWTRRNPASALNSSVPDACSGLSTLSQSNLKTKSSTKTNNYDLTSGEAMRSIARGKDILRTRCLSCHMTNEAEGGSLPLVDEKPLADALKAGFYDKILKRINSDDVTKRMPFKRSSLLEDEKAAVINYLDSVKEEK
jgi:hypothetical protein